MIILRFFYSLFYLTALLLAIPFSAKMRLFWKQRIQKSNFSKLPNNNSSSPYWIHCASGEFEYAKPVLKMLKERGFTTLVTYFSPTYSKQVLKSPWVDFAEPLPLDLAGPIQSFIQQHKPKELWIARTDLWPEVLRQCRAASIPCVLFSATQSKKMSGLSGYFKRTLMNQLDRIYTVSEDDKLNLQQSSITSDISAIGDTRYDQVQARLQNVQSLAPLENSNNSILPILIAGSTWPEDEKVLFTTLPLQLKEQKLRLILVPHEPDEEHIKSIKEQLDRMQIGYDTWSSVDQWTNPVLLVDKVGILADIYPYANLAFVGGSFKSTVHSVMEALAAGCPTLLGPHCRNNREAIEFSKIPLEASANKMNCVEICEDSKAFLNKLNEALENIDLIRSRKELQQKISKRTGASKLLIEAQLIGFN